MEKNEPLEVNSDNLFIQVEATNLSTNILFAWNFEKECYDEIGRGIYCENYDCGFRVGKSEEDFTHFEFDEQSILRQSPEHCSHAELIEKFYFQGFLIEKEDTFILKPFVGEEVILGEKVEDYLFADYHHDGTYTLSSLAKEFHLEQRTYNTSCKEISRFFYIRQLTGELYDLIKKGYYYCAFLEEKDSPVIAHNAADDILKVFRWNEEGQGFELLENRTEVFKVFENAFIQCTPNKKGLYVDLFMIENKKVVKIQSGKFKQKDSSFVIDGYVYKDENSRSKLKKSVKKTLSRKVLEFFHLKK